MVMGEEVEIQEDTKNVYHRHPDSIFTGELRGQEKIMGQNHFSLEEFQFHTSREIKRMKETPKKVLKFNWIS